MEKENKFYLQGYKEGFESALKIAWAYANDLYISVDNVDKDKVEKFIKKLKS